MPSFKDPIIDPGLDPARADLKAVRTSIPRPDCRARAEHHV